jgi:acyl carrier protein
MTDEGTPMSADDEEARRELRLFIERNFLYLHPDIDLKDGDELLKLGVIDSLGFVELVEVVQDRFDIPIADVEITEDNFGSIDGIVSFIGRKRPQA